MDQICDDMTTARLAMRLAFLELSTWARANGFDPDEMTRLHGQFFDGNVGVKRAFNLVLWIAVLRGWQR